MEPDLNSDGGLNLIFRQLKLFTCNFFAEPSEKNLDSLLNFCDGVEPKCVGKFVFYIFVPFGAHMSENDEKKTCFLLGSFTNVLRKCEITDLDSFLNIYLAIFKKIIDDNNSPAATSTTSEELKLEVIKCISQLLKSSSNEVLTKFISKKYYSKLCIGVFTCLQIATNEKFLSLRLEALKCLQLLTYVSEEQQCEPSYRKDLGDVLMFMLPGVSSKCLKILSDNETQNHKPILLALQLWSRILALVMSNPSIDNNLPLKFSLQQTEKSKFPNVNNTNEFQLSEDGTPKTIRRDTFWMQKTDENLQNMMKFIIKLHTHKMWKVRLELARSSFHLLDNCGSNMPLSSGYLAEILALLSQDENSEVKEFVQSRIFELSQKFETSSGQKLMDIVEENVFTLLTRLPRIIRGNDISQKEKELTLFCGLVDILGTKHFPMILSSVGHLERLLHCLLVCAEPQSASVSILGEPALRDFSTNYHSPETKWRHLNHCNSSKCETLLQSLCRKLVDYSDFEVLINRLLDEFNSSSKIRKNVLVLFIYIFSSGTSDEFCKSYSKLLRDVITSLMDPSLWKVQLVFTDETNETRAAIQENVIQVCLLTELIGWLSMAFGKQTFSPFLFDCLYQVLESAANPLAIISSAGQMSLHMLSKSYEGQVSLLIKDNVDYLSHQVMLKLRVAHKNPLVLSVLSVIMEYTSLNMISSLHDIINDVLIQSCDTFQDINGSAFLQVFHSYLTCIKKWTFKTPLTALRDSPSLFQEEKQKEIILDLIQYKKALQDAKITEEDTIDDLAESRQFVDENETENKPEDGEEVKPKLPDHIKLTKDILTRSLHFLPANNISRQILVIEIMNMGVDILSTHENELLPIVHKIWSPLVERFKISAHPLLLQRAFSLLSTLAKYSKDFIRNRTSKSVLPVLLEVLKKSSKESERADPTGAYRMKQIYKLQMLLLTNLGKLANYLLLDYKDTYLIVSSVGQFLSSRQPKSLQEACISLYEEIGQNYPDIVWAYLMTLCPVTVELKTHTDGLKSFQFDVDNVSHQEFLSSVETILSKI